MLNYEKEGLTGLIIIAEEGINGTICGEDSITKRTIKLIKNYFNNEDLNEKLSFSKNKVFKKLKIKIKSEIVTMGISNLNLNKRGTYVNAFEWNKLLNDKNTLIIDTRNDYEVSLGGFINSINPKTRSFREFPNWVDENIDKYLNGKQVDNIAMFCTGGIRCEKASFFLKKKGFKNVYQLKGGILNYLKKVNKKKSLWKGECFVFDNRISVKHGLIKGTYSMCSGCRKPISPKDKKSTKYEEGVSCPNCHDRLSNSQKERFRMRQKQINLAKKSGKKHIFQKEFN